MKDGIKLSILICSLPERINFLSKLLEQLKPQLTEEVELLILTDNRTNTIGAKRNKLITMSKGEYVVFIDDDDRIAEDYVSNLLMGIQRNTDVVTFEAQYSHNGEWTKKVKYDYNINGDFNTDDCFYRLPNGICCWKKQEVKGMFNDINTYEDRDFAIRMKSYNLTGYHINKVLYYYDYNDKTTTTIY